MQAVAGAGDFAQVLSERFEEYIVRLGGGISFAQLVLLEREGDPTLRGDHAVTMDMPKGGFVVYWAGVSADFVAAISRMLKRGRVVPKPTSVMVYMADGAMLKFPVLTRMPSGPLKEPKWVPIVFNLPKPVRKKKAQ